MTERATERGTSRLRELSDAIRELETRLRLGGGADKIARQHKQGKLTARERIDRLRDPDARFLEIGLLVAYDQYDGQAPAAGVGATGSSSWRGAVRRTGVASSAAQGWSVNTGLPSAPTQRWMDVWASALAANTARIRLANHGSADSVRMVAAYVVDATLQERSLWRSGSLR